MGPKFEIFLVGIFLLIFSCFPLVFLGGETSYRIFWAFLSISNFILVYTFFSQSRLTPKEEEPQEETTTYTQAPYVPKSLDDDDNFDDDDEANFDDDEYEDSNTSQLRFKTKL